MTLRPGEVHRCPTCGEEYGDQATVCPVDGTPLGDATRPPAIGRTLRGRYLLKRKVGAGAFGVVFEAEDTRLNKQVAVKILAPRVAAKPDALARFEREARAAGRIGHAGIVDVTDFDRDDDGTRFMVMQYIDGPDLAKVIREEGPLEPGRALLIAMQIAEALDAAHASGIVHRDLKPGNILLTEVGGVEEFVKILDFGISKVAERTSAAEALTATGDMLGTPLYMAPEQVLGEREIDGRADVYSLGVILFEMLTKQVPFSGPTHYAVIHKKLYEPPLAPSLVAPALCLPDEVDDVVTRALARERDARFASAREYRGAMLQALKAFAPEAASMLRPALGKRGQAPLGPSADELGNAPTEVLAEAPTVDERRGAASDRVSEEAAVPGSTWRIPRRAPRRPLPLFLLLAVALAGAGIFLAIRGTRETPGAGDETAAGPVQLQAIPMQEIRTTDAGVPPDAAAKARIRLVVSPSNARVLVDGVPITDRELHLEKSHELHELQVSAPGYVTETREFKAWGDGELEVRLEPLKKKHEKRKKKRRAPPATELPDDPV